MPTLAVAAAAATEIAARARRLIWRWKLAFGKVEENSANWAWLLQ
jgi:hypothetical protein